MKRTFGTNRIGYLADIVFSGFYSVDTPAKFEPALLS